MQRVTIITFSSWEREMILEPYADTSWKKDIASVHYPEVSSSEVNEVMTATLNKVQHLLSKL